MRIKPLALATACALVPCLSHAVTYDIKDTSVTLYGVASLDALGASNVYDATTKTSTDKFYLDNGSQTSSRFGIKGEHVINPGLKAIFGLEAGLQADTGQTASGQLFNRGTYLGLQGNFGKLTAGRQWNLNDDTFGAYFVFGGYAVFRLSEFGDVSNLYNNSIKYYTPSFGGLQFGVMAGAGEAKSSSDGGNMGEAVVTYGIGGFSAAVSYHANKDGAGSKTDRLTTAGLNYQIGPVKPRFGYSIAHYPSLSSNAVAYDLGVDWAITPPVLLSVDYVARDQKESPDDTQFFRVRLIYAIDSAVSIYGNVVLMDNKGVAKERFYGDGLAGQKQNVFGIGMQYVF
jgi:predicted porin